MLADHPLSAFIKTEEEEEGEGTSCAVSATAATSVKQEAEPEAGELPDVKKEEEREVLTDEAQSEESKV